MRTTRTGMITRTATSSPGRPLAESCIKKAAGEFSGDQSAYGDLRRTAVPQTGANDPDAYRDLDPDDTADLARPYPVQQGRGERWRAFEENLRKNRVDVTASCRSCSPAKDRAA